MIYLVRALIVADCVGFGFLVDAIARNRARQNPLDALGRCVLRARRYQ